MTDDPSRAITARPTIYNGTPMRSRLEARYAAWLDRRKMRWEYEPCAFGNGDGQYLPDFRIHDVFILNAPRTLYVDVKPHFAGARQVLDRMAIIWSTDPDAFLAVDAPGDDSDPRVIFSYPADLGFVPEVGLWTCAYIDGQWLPAIGAMVTFHRWKVA